MANAKFMPKTPMTKNKSDLDLLDTDDLKALHNPFKDTLYRKELLMDIGRFKP